MEARLIILGAGGNSLSIIDAVEAANAAGGLPRHRIIGILDDLPENRDRSVHGYPVLGPIERGREYADCVFVNGISSVGSFRKRSEIASRAGASADRLATVIHPAAVVSSRAAIGRGSVVLAGSVICPQAVLEEHVLILQGTTVNHHARIGRHATLSAGITVLGHVQVGELAFIGGGSSLAPYVRVGEGALVGMGSVVIRDVAPGRVVAGNPAREIEASPYAG